MIKILDSPIQNMRMTKVRIMVTSKYDQSSSIKSEIFEALDIEFLPDFFPLTISFQLYLTFRDILVE